MRLAVLISVSIVGCKKVEGTTVATDSVSSIADTTLQQASASPDSLAKQDSISWRDDLDQQLKLAEDRILGNVNDYYRVTIHTNQYEAGADVTWYFSKNDFSPRYYKETWSIEGRNGEVEYILDDVGIGCYYSLEENGETSTTTSICRGNEGYIFTTGGEENEERVGDDVLLNSAREFQSLLEGLKSELRQNEPTDTTIDSYSIHNEHVVDVGFDYTETSDIETSIVLFDFLTGH